LTGLKSKIPLDVSNTMGVSESGSMNVLWPNLDSDCEAVTGDEAGGAGLISDDQCSSCSTGVGEADGTPGPNFFGRFEKDLAAWEWSA